mgnify:CR=1 FL=1|tara:strand:- start:1445 stop:1792 length:348 start_codon:yes stop_codon:yes gene_type:complete
MARKGIFPFFGEDLQTTSGAANWDGKSGFIKVAGAHNITFNTANYNGDGEVAIESGQAIYVQNSHDSAIDVIITGGPFGDVTGDTASVAAGESVTVLYHETHGFIFLGGMEIELG